MAEKNNQILVKILSFFKKIPVLRQIIVFFEFWHNFAFGIFIDQRFGHAKEDIVRKSRADLFTDWFLYIVIPHGLLWYAPFVLIYGFPLHPFYPIGLGIARYAFLGFYNDTVMPVVNTIARGLMRK